MLRKCRAEKRKQGSPLVSIHESRLAPMRRRKLCKQAYPLHKQAYLLHLLKLLAALLKMQKREQVSDEGNKAQDS